MDSAIQTRVLPAVPLVLFGVVVVEAVSAFETTMAYQLLFARIDFFGSDISQLTWILTAYLLVAAASAGVVGRLGDQFGRRKVAVVVLLISAVGSIISAAAPNVEVVIAGRALQGVSGALLPLAIGLAREWLPKPRITLGISMIGMTALLAGSAGSIFGGVVVDNADWRLIFVVGAVFAVLATFVALRVFPSDRRGTAVGGRVDYAGALGFALGVALVLYGVTQLRSLGFTSPVVWSFIGGGAVVLAVWVMIELRVSNPVIDLRRFRNPKFTLAILATAAGALGIFGILPVLTTGIMRAPEGLPVGLGLTATLAGVLSGVGSVIGFACSPLVARLSNRLGAARTVMTGCTVAVLGYGALLFTYHSFWPFVINLVILTAFATGLTYAGLPTLIAECVPEAETSAATGIQAVVRTAFQGVASALVGITMGLSAVTEGSASFMSPTGLQASLGVAIGASIVALLLAYGASRSKGNALLQDSRAQTPASAATPASTN